MNEATARRLVTERCQDVCEICGARRGQEWHHRRLRAQGGRWCPANGLRLDRDCHRMVTDTRGRRAECEHYGWIVPSTQDPRLVPAWVHNPTLGHAWAWLRVDGGVSGAGDCACPAPGLPSRLCVIHGGGA